MAAPRAGTTPQTVRAWLARGRAGADAQAVEFASRYDELIAARKVAEAVEQATGLSEGEALDEHECARQFALTALRRGDSMVATEPILMAELTEPEQLRAIKLSGPPPGRSRRRT